MRVRSLFPGHSMSGHIKLCLWLLAVTTAVASAAGCASSPSPGKPTVGGLAPAGNAVFTSRCARCHGASGQGDTAPAVIGAGANLVNYRNAGTLYKFLSTTMPWDSPGSLSQDEYLQVMSFLIVENRLSEPQREVDPQRLDSLVFKK